MPDNAPSASDLLSQAQRETSSADAASIGPLQGDIGRIEGGQATALAGLNEMFGNLLPYVKGSAQRVTDWYKQGLAQEQGIFKEAQQRLGGIRAQRAAEAQAMAQKIGGPVPVESFLAPLNTSMAELPNAAAGTLLHSNALSQGGVQEVEAFAGRVFPLLQTEQAAQIRNAYQARISAIQDEISGIRASSAGRTQSRLDDLLQREREYQLEQERMALEKLKADRDWQLAKQQLAAQRQQNIEDRANLLGYYERSYTDKQGNRHTYRVPTLGGQQLAEARRSEQARLAEQHRSTVVSDTETRRAHIQGELLDQRAITQRKVEAAAAAKANALEMAQQQRESAAKYIDAVTTPGSSTVSYTRYDRIPTAQLKSPANPNGIDKSSLIPRRMPDGTTGWFKATSVTEPITTPVIENPTEVYKYLIDHATPPTIAREMVRKRFNLGPKWKPGQKYDPSNLTGEDLMAMDFNALRREARKRGWKPDPQHPATGRTLREWLARQEGVTLPAAAPPPGSESGIGAGAGVGG